MSDFSQETLAAYSYVERVTSTADDKDKIMWHGWALRDAFVAGSVWQREREQNNEQRDGMSIFINSCARCGKNHTVRFNRFVSGDIDGYNEEKYNQAIVVLTALVAFQEIYEKRTRDVLPFNDFYRKRIMRIINAARNIIKE